MFDQNFPGHLEMVVFVCFCLIKVFLHLLCFCCIMLNLVVGSSEMRQFKSQPFWQDFSGIDAFGDPDLIKVRKALVLGDVHILLIDDVGFVWFCCLMWFIFSNSYCCDP